MPLDTEAAYADHRDLVVATAQAVLRDRGLAEDVAQDVFERLWRQGGWDPERGPLVPFLRLLARSRALDVVRSRTAADRTRERFLAADRPATAHEPADESAVRTLDERRVRAAVRALPDRQREAIALAYWGGLSSAEVADATAAPQGTAKSRVRLGVLRLRTELAAA